MNAEGEYVVAEPDQASWEKYQAKAQASAAQQEAAAADGKELQERGLECPLDKRLFVNPMKTPCCGQIYCNDCIENALVNSDLVCPNCSREGVLIDDLVPDEETIAKIKAYEDEKAAARKAKERSKSPTSAKPVSPVDGKTAKKTSEQEQSDPRGTESKSPPPTKNSTKSSDEGARKPTTTGTSKKRPAEEPLENVQAATKAPAIREQQQTQAQQNPSLNPNAVKHMNNLTPTSLPTQSFSSATFPPVMSMNGMTYPNSNAMMSMGMSMSPMMAMSTGMMNPMNPMMMQQNGVGPWPNMAGMNGMGSMPFVPQPGMYGGFNNGMMMSNGGGYGQQPWAGGHGWGMNGGGYPQQQAYQQYNMPNMPNNMRNGAGGGGEAGVFPNQQQTVFSEPFPNEEDNAYFRKPVNPHRHQNRQRRARPSDYTEL